MLCGSGRRGPGFLHLLCRVLSATVRNAVRITNNRVNDLKTKYLLLLEEKMGNSNARLNKIQIGF